MDIKKIPNKYLAEFFALVHEGYFDDDIEKAYYTMYWEKSGVYCILNNN